MGKDFNPFKKFIEADPKIEPKRSTEGSTALKEQVIILAQSHQKLKDELTVAKNRFKISEEKLAITKDKLETIKKVLPNYNTTALWEAGPTLLVQKIRTIVGVP